MDKLSDHLSVDVKSQALALAELVKKDYNTPEELKRIRILSEAVAMKVAIVVDAETK